MRATCTPVALPAPDGATLPWLARSLLSAEAHASRTALAKLVLWAPGWRAAHALALRLAMLDLSARMVAGATPRQVAIYVLMSGPILPALSRAIENAAHPGTFAEAVFAILAD